MTVEQERADFEVWCTLYAPVLFITYIRDDNSDRYVSEYTQAAWEAWQARAALQSQGREDAGMTEIVREAAQIIAAIPPEHAPDNIRWPIIDELEGFASKIDHARRNNSKRQEN